MASRGREVKGCPGGGESDTLDVYDDVVWVLGKDEAEAGGLCVFCVRIRHDCFQSDNKIAAFAMVTLVSPSEARVASTASEVM